MKSEIIKGLLSKGYFPKELPPVFTTEDFGTHAEDILGVWRASGVFSTKPAKKIRTPKGKVDKRGSYEYEGLPICDPEIFSKPKRQRERRNIAITHPVPQALLVNELAENWRSVQKWLSKQRYSEDEIIVSSDHERAIKGINFGLHRAKKSYIEATADWLVETDISRFYPSLYTHSIPWAAYGKERVKQELDLYKGSFADRLDALIRSCNRNQTIGIPIGPETSRIVAEIISSRIDLEFERVVAHDDLPEMLDRLQDDWSVGARSLEHAERLLSKIMHCYREFGLEINGSKTEITHILGARQSNWKSEITGFKSHRPGPMVAARLEEFLALCLRHQVKSPGQPVLSYALAIIENQRFSGRDVEILESFLLKAAVVAPLALDRICRIILNIDHQTGGLSKKRIAKRFTELAEICASRGELYEVIWLIYTIRGLKCSVTSRSLIDSLADAPSSAVRLIFLDLKSKGQCPLRLPTQRWEADINIDRIKTDWTWLYAYEAIRKGWLNDRAGVMAHPFFSEMDSRDVVFYDPKRNIPTSRHVKDIMWSVRKRQRGEIMDYLQKLRDTDWMYWGDDGSY